MAPQRFSSPSHFFISHRLEATYTKTSLIRSSHPHTNRSVIDCIQPHPPAPIALTTRGTNALTTPTAQTSSKSKASSRSTASSRSKASSNAKTASRTNSTLKAARKTAAVPPNNPDIIEILATPSSGTVSPYRIDETDIEAPNDHNVLRPFI